MKNILIIILITLPFLAGCAGIESSLPQKVFPPWSGTQNLKIGTSKDKVLKEWGEPSERVDRGIDDVGLLIEEWVYYGEYPLLNRKILSQGARLTFTGSSLTSFKAGEEPKE